MNNRERMNRIENDRKNEIIRLEKEECSKTKS